MVTMVSMVTVTGLASSAKPPFMLPLQGITHWYC